MEEAETVALLRTAGRSVRQCECAEAASARNAEAPRKWRREVGGRDAVDTLADLWFRRLTRSPYARLRLFVFPCSGASAYTYAEWGKEMPRDLEAFALQLPGRGDRYGETPLTDLTELTRRIADAVQQLMDQPYLFFGHSLGSLVSFETVRELRRRRALLPAHLFVAGRAAPQLPDPDPPMHVLPDRELITEISSLGGIPEEVRAHAELLEMVLPVLRADLFLHETYEYREEPPLACSITALGGSEDWKTPEEDLLAWSAQTTGRFRYLTLAGNHFFVHRERARIIRLMCEGGMPESRETR